MDSFSMAFSVFVSHGWHDRWLARQIAENIQRTSGAAVFIDIFDVQSGDRIEEKVREGLRACDELISLLTPWSVGRNWVWAEMAGVWVQNKRYVGVTYGLTLDEIDKSYGGIAILAPTNVIDINAIDTYLSEAGARVRSRQND